MADDEAQLLLASLDATIQEQDVYEDEVIRQATNAAVPVLQQGINGFPSLKDLAASSLNVIYTILSQIRREQQHQPKGKSDVLHLQEQMLLSLLTEMGVRIEDLPLRTNEARYEQDRAEKCRQRSNTSIAEALPNNSSSSALASNGHRSAPRVPMMKRKRLQEEQLEEGEDIAKQKEELLFLRQKRMKRREERRKQLEAVFGNMDDSSEEEELDVEKADVDVEKEEDTVFGGSCDDEEAKTDDDENNDVGLSSVICPLCQATVAIRDPAETDAVLSQHMDQCQRTSSRRSTRRGTRGTLSTVPVTPKQRVAAGTIGKRTHAAAKRRQDVILPTYSDAQDDFEEWVYTDRVDAWIEEGLSKMKVMKERDEHDTLPGATTFPGGLHIPAWVNDRLFQYQREGVKWMWDLHEQNVGGIIGDEMGLVRQTCLFSYSGRRYAHSHALYVLSCFRGKQFKSAPFWAPWHLHGSFGRCWSLHQPHYSSIG